MIPSDLWFIAVTDRMRKRWNLSDTYEGRLEAFTDTMLCAGVNAGYLSREEYEAISPSAWLTIYDRMGEALSAR